MSASWGSRTMKVRYHNDETNDPPNFSAIPHDALNVGLGAIGKIKVYATRAGNCNGLYLIDFSPHKSCAYCSCFWHSPSAHQICEGWQALSPIRDMPPLNWNVCKRIDIELEGRLSYNNRQNYACLLCDYYSEDSCKLSLLSS